MVLTALGGRTKDPNATDRKDVSIRLFQSFGEVNSVLLETVEDDSEAGYR